MSSSFIHKRVVNQNLVLECRSAKSLQPIRQRGVFIGRISTLIKGIARCSGATIVNRAEELSEKDVGTACGLFEVKKIGEEYFTFMTECDNPKACTVLLRGASKDVLNEMEVLFVSFVGTICEPVVTVGSSRRMSFVFSRRQLPSHVSSDRHLGVY